MMCPSWAVLQPGMHQHLLQGSSRLLAFRYECVMITSIACLSSAGPQACSRPILYPSLCCATDHLTSTQAWDTDSMCLLAQAVRPASARPASPGRRRLGAAESPTAASRLLRPQHTLAEDVSASRAASSISMAVDLQPRTQPDDEGWRIMSGMSVSRPVPGNDDEDAMSVHERLSATELASSLIPAR